MLEYIKVGWKWLVGIIVASLVTLLISYISRLIFKRKVFFGLWRLVWRFRSLLVRLVRRFASLLAIHWASLVLILFGILWILDRKVNLLLIHWVGLLLVLFAVFIWILDHKVRHLNGKVSHLEEYVTSSFEDDFKADLKKNWDYRGTWRLIPGGRLSVTQSEKGGITRVGHLWTDYNFEFTAVIVNRCIAWIVRAQDLFNYYMIQLDPDKVRPHLRFRGRWISAPQKQYRLAIDSKEHGLPIQVADPIGVRTEVRGWEIRVYVENKEIYHKQDFFSMRFINEKFELVPFGLGVEAVPPFITGRVGFREFKEEHGRFSWCRVRPL